MRTEGPVDRIVSILESSQAFRRVGTPIKIGNVQFDFAAVLFGTGKNPDLVVVIDTISEDGQRTRQKIGGLGRALDVVGSRRPVTAILTGPRPDEATLEVITRVCRVLAVGTGMAHSCSQSCHMSSVVSSLTVREAARYRFSFPYH